MGMGGLFLVSREESVVVLNTGATANIASIRWLARHSRILGNYGAPRVTTYSSKARCRFGDGRLGEVRHAADIPLRIAGNKGKHAAFAPDADIPALLRRGALEALGGQLEFLRGSLVLRRQGVKIPLMVNRVDFRKDPSKSASRCPEASASFFHIVQEAPDLSD